jgi:hypothetical protein
VWVLRGQKGCGVTASLLARSRVTRAHKHTRMHTCARKRTRARAHTSTRTHTQTQTHTHTYAHIHTHMHKHTHTQTNTCTHTLIHTCSSFLMSPRSTKRARPNHAASPSRRRQPRRPASGAACWRLEARAAHGMPLFVLHHAQPGAGHPAVNVAQLHSVWLGAQLMPLPGAYLFNACRAKGMQYGLLVYDPPLAGHL